MKVCRPTRMLRKYGCMVSLRLWMELAGIFRAFGGDRRQAAITTAQRDCAITRQSNKTQVNLVKLFFSYSPPPEIHPPPPPTPLPGSRFRVVFRSFSSRSRVAIRNRLKVDSKTTEKRLEMDSWERGRWWWGMNPGVWAVADKQFHYVNLRF